MLHTGFEIGGSIIAPHSPDEGRVCERSSGIEGLQRALDKGHARRSVRDAFPAVGGHASSSSSRVGFAHERLDGLDEHDVVDQGKEDVRRDAADAGTDIQRACPAIDPRWGERTEGRGDFAQFWEDIEQEQT